MRLPPLNPGTPKPKATEKKIFSALLALRKAQNECKENSTLRNELERIVKKVYALDEQMRVELKKR